MSRRELLRPTPTMTAMTEQVDAALARMIQLAGEQGIAPADVHAVLQVTDRTDVEVELITRRAAAAGLGSKVVLVDDCNPARPGTVHSSTLARDQVDELAAIRAELLAHDSDGQC